MPHREADQRLKLLHDRRPRIAQRQIIRRGARGPADALGSRGPLLPTPLELIKRIADLVPPPRVHRQRYFSVLVEWPLTGNFRGDPERQELAGEVSSMKAEADATATPRSLP